MKEIDEATIKLERRGIADVNLTIAVAISGAGRYVFSVLLPPVAPGENRDRIADITEQVQDLVRRACS